MVKEEKEVLLEDVSFKFTKDMGAEHIKGYTWKYWNFQGKIGIYILAVVNIHKGIVFDWSVYIGASVAGSKRELDGVLEVADDGSKMSSHEAFALFPQFKDCHYRW